MWRHHRPSECRSENTVKYKSFAPRMNQSRLNLAWKNLSLVYSVISNLAAIIFGIGDGFIFLGSALCMGNSIKVKLGTYEHSTGSVSCTKFYCDGWAGRRGSPKYSKIFQIWGFWPWKSRFRRNLIWKTTPEVHFHTPNFTLNSESICSGVVHFEVIDKKTKTGLTWTRTVIQICN